jgi:hypothetical protein
MAQAVFPPDPIECLIESQMLLQRPEVKKMAEMDKAMADLLSRTDLTADARLREYMNLFARFKNLREDVIINGPVLDPNMISMSSVLGNKNNAILVADEVNKLFSPQNYTPQPSTPVRRLYNEDVEQTPNSGRWNDDEFLQSINNMFTESTPTQIRGTPDPTEPIDNEAYATVLRQPSPSQLNRLSKEPDTNLAEEFLTAVNSSENLKKKSKKNINAY